VNTDAPWPTLEEAEARVLGIQTKLHQWATDSPQRCSYVLSSADLLSAARQGWATRVRASSY
jgi:hypothetical protein